ncbi:unnamed protein product, partial [Allacma fusca]
MRVCYLLVLCAFVSGNRFPQHKYTNNHYVAAASQHVPQQVMAQGGYKYPAPVVASGNAPRPLTVPYPTGA